MTRPTPLICQNLANISRVPMEGITGDAREILTFLLVIGGSGLFSLPRRCAMNTKGFTLIELLICVAILAILACIAYVSYQPFIEKVRAIAP